MLEQISAPYDAITNAPNFEIAVLVFLAYVIAALIRVKTNVRIVNRVFNSLNLIGKILLTTVFIIGAFYSSAFRIGTSLTFAVAAICSTIVLTASFAFIGWQAEPDAS